MKAIVPIARVWLLSPHFNGVDNPVWSSGGVISEVKFAWFLGRPMFIVQDFY